MITDDDGSLDLRSYIAILAGKTREEVSNKLRPPQEVRFILGVWELLMQHDGASGEVYHALTTGGGNRYLEKPYTTERDNVIRWCRRFREWKDACLKLPLQKRE